MKHRTLTMVIGWTLLGVLSSTQAQSVFRWVDSTGRVHYTDHPPEEAVKQIQEKRITHSMIQTSGDSYAMQVAARKFPATFFTSGDCGEVCEKAKAFLDKRGVSYTEVDANSQSSKLIKITGNTKVPVLTLGTTTVVRGWEENRWTSALDQAGYPKHFVRAISRDNNGQSNTSTDTSTQKSDAAAPKSGPN